MGSAVRCSIRVLNGRGVENQIPEKLPWPPSLSSTLPNKKVLPTWSETARSQQHPMQPSPTELWVWVGVLGVEGIVGHGYREPQRQASELRRWPLPTQHASLKSLVVPRTVVLQSDEASWEIGSRLVVTRDPCSCARTPPDWAIQSQ